MNNSNEADQSENRVVPLRLQKYLARAGVASRRGSEDLMTAHRVKVNGVVVSELGSKVDPRVDVVTVDDKVVRLSDEATTIILYKPAGVVTTMSDPQGRPVVASLIPRKEYPGLFPVGRLDTDTTGLLLFTTDGELGNGLLHPRHHVDKTYLALVEGSPDLDVIQRLEQGIELEDGMTAPARAEVLPTDEALRILSLFYQGEASTHNAKHQKALKTGTLSLVRLTIHEGRKHQVKRMLDAVGHPVCLLHRESFGPLVLGSLTAGEWRRLNEAEVAQLHAAIKL